MQLRRSWILAAAAITMLAPPTDSGAARRRPDFVYLHQAREGQLHGFGFNDGALVPLAGFPLALTAGQIDDRHPYQSLAVSKQHATLVLAEHGQLRTFRMERNGSLTPLRTAATQPEPTCLALVETRRGSVVLCHARFTGLLAFSLSDGRLSLIPNTTALGDFEATRMVVRGQDVAICGPQSVKVVRVTDTAPAGIVEAPGSPFPIGNGGTVALGMDVSKDGKWLYGVSEDGSWWSFKFSRSGSLTRATGSPFTPIDSVNGAGGVVAGPGNLQILVGTTPNAGLDGFQALIRQPNGAVLTLGAPQNSPQGSGSAFAISDAKGRFLLGASVSGDFLASYLINRYTGALTQIDVDPVPGLEDPTGLMLVEN